MLEKIYSLNKKHFSVQDVRKCQRVCSTHLNMINIMVLQKTDICYRIQKSSHTTAMDSTYGQNVRRLKFTILGVDVTEICTAAFTLNSAWI
jgi:hypothetical protein